MLKLRKKLFLILSMVGVILCLVSCIPDGYIKLKFDEELYTIKVGEKLDVMPTIVKDSHESNYELVYESSEQTIATYIDGIVTGLKEGTTKLKVFVKNNPSVYATTTINVVYTETLDVKFDVKDSMLKGQTYKISYVPQEGCVDPIITYKSNDDKILTVDNDGNVLAVSKGTTQIIARVTSSVDGIQYREYIFDVTVLEEIYEIEYVLDGGINHPNNPTSYADSDLPIILNSPSKAGYTFDGWYLDAAFTSDKIIELNTSMSGKVTLYAKWTATKYAIYYQLDGGINNPNNPQGYDILTLPVELLEPTKEDYQFLGWYLNDQLIDKLDVGLEGDVTLFAKWEQIAYLITFELEGGVCDNLPTKYLINEITLLPIPTKEGYKFLGWYLKDELIEQINGEQRGDITLVAKWEQEQIIEKDLIVDPNDENAYATIEEALDVAKDGDTILVVAGTYQGFTINKSVTINGANWGINPVKDTRNAETIFTSDILIYSNNVVIDGIALTEKGRIVGSTSGVSNIKLSNIYCYESTVNPTAQDSSTAPIHFVPQTNDAHAIFEDLELINLKYEKSTGRPMIFYGMQIVNLTIKGCSFVGNSANYNDGIKIDSTASFGVKGNVSIINNHFENYSQYTIWIRSYGEGTYEIKNNTFKNCGQTAGSHAATTFVKYSGSQTGTAKIEFQYNKVDNSYMLFRLDATADMGENTHDVHVNYNKLLNSLATYYIKNAYTFNIDGANNYYDSTPVASKFMGVDGWDTYYENETDVPEYVDENADLWEIEYILNGGTLPANAPTKYDSEVGLTRLPVPTNGNLVFVGWYLNDQKVTTIEKGTTGNIVLSAKWREDALYVGVGEDWYYPTLVAALEDAKEGSKIIILAGEYNENVTISLANLTIVGPNVGVNPNTLAREEEAILTGVITILATANNLTIDGLSFTKGAKIVGSENKNYHNFKFVNNLVYDTNSSTTDWVINRYVMNGFVEFNLPSGGSTNNFYFANNRFTNVSDVNLLINRVVNLSVEGNVFLDFDRDGIRCEGGYNQGIISFTNNHFEQSVKHNGYNAIFMYALSGPSGSNTIVYILNNTFKQIGTDNSNAVPYNGAISAHIFQENKTAWEIVGNVFDHCYNDMWLRNNGASTSNWSCKIDNNQFLGLPTTHYFGTYQGSDTETTNPHLAEFGANYYESNDGEVITDLTPYASLFKHLKTSGTTLSSKPNVVEAKPLEFYVINYELDGGSLKGNYPTAYNSLISESIVLPIPTKLNYEFLGWSLNGDYVTEIPATSRGDIVLVAEWKVVEGEIYDVTYKFNGGYSEELLVANSGNALHLTINNYNYNNGTFWGGRYTDDIFIGTSSYDPGATFSDRIYIAKNLETGLYEIVQIISSGASSWPEGAEYVITISNSYNNYWASINPITTKLAVGQMIAFDKAIEDITADEPAIVYFFSEVPENDTLVVPSRYSDKLIVPGYLGYKFLGWYDSEDNLYTSLETLNGDLTLYAKWEQLNPVTNIRVDEICDELETGDTFQIVASVEPSDAYFKDLFYESSNTDIITISSTGLITAINAGKATITIYDYLRKVTYQHEIIVNSIQSVDVTFEEYYDGSICIDDTLQIIATAYGKGTENAKFIYESSDENILTVSETGLVTALANGKANVLVTIEGTKINLSVCITVGVYSEDTDIDRLIALLAKNNFAVVETGNISLYNDGVERVYVSTYGSVNRYLFDEFKVDETYYATSEANPNNHKERRSVDTIEFVTVHDTATLTGTVVSIAQGMSSGETSIHYTVGNDAIYGVVPEKYIAYHAGDGTSASFTWTKTNVVAIGNIAPKFDVVQSGSTYYLSLNGTVTQIEVPTINGAAPSASYLSILGPTWKVEDGYYYIGGPLWYSSSYNTIGSRGGNNNSIGIEMCSNLSGDIYDTFQRTAQLVADILLRNGLDTTRVKMHNTWSGKNCPQTMISGSYWDSFMEMVELQYEIQKNYSNAKISIKSNNPDIIDNTGRVIKAPAITTTVSYDLTVELNGQTKTITLHSIVPGTTTWEQWDGTYPASRVWNNGIFAR